MTESQRINAVDRFRGYQRLGLRVDKYDEGQNPKTELPKDVVVGRIWIDVDGNEVEDSEAVAALDAWFAERYGGT